MTAFDPKRTLAVHLPAEPRTLAAYLGSDLPGGLAGLALVPQVGHGALKRTVTAPAVDHLIAAVVEIFVLVR